MTNVNNGPRDQMHNQAQYSIIVTFLYKLQLSDRDFKDININFSVINSWLQQMLLIRYLPWKILRPKNVLAVVERPTDFFGAGRRKDTTLSMS